MKHSSSRRPLTSYKEIANSLSTLSPSKEMVLMSTPVLIPQLTLAPIELLIVEYGHISGKRNPDEDISDTQKHNLLSSSSHKNYDKNERVPNTTNKLPPQKSETREEYNNKYSSFSSEWSQSKSIYNSRNLHTCVSYTCIPSQFTIQTFSDYKKNITLLGLRKHIHVCISYTLMAHQIVLHLIRQHVANTPPLTVKFDIMLSEILAKDNIQNLFNKFAFKLQCTNKNDVVKQSGINATAMGNVKFKINYLKASPSNQDSKFQMVNRCAIQISSSNKNGNKSMLGIFSSPLWMKRKQNINAVQAQYTHLLRKPNKKYSRQPQK